MQGRTRLHRQGTGRLKHMDVAYVWVQDGVGSKILRVNEKENVPDLGTKALSKAVIMNHSVTQGDVNMTEKEVEVVQRNVATFWDFGSRQHSANAEKSGTCDQHLSQTHQLVGSRCARRQRSTCLSACGKVVPLCSHHLFFFCRHHSQRCLIKEELMAD